MGKKRGRPGLGPHAERRVRIQDEVYALAAQLAEIRGISVPELIRRLLRNEVLACMDEIKAGPVDQLVLKAKAS